MNETSAAPTTREPPTPPPPPPKPRDPWDWGTEFDTGLIVFMCFIPFSILAFFVYDLLLGWFR